MDKLILTIQMKLHIQRHEAEAVADKLIDRLCEIVEDGGQMFCNDDRLAAVLQSVRDEDRQARTRLWR